MTIERQNCGRDTADRCGGGVDRLVSAPVGGAARRPDAWAVVCWLRDFGAGRTLRFLFALGRLRWHHTVARATSLAEHTARRTAALVARGTVQPDPQVYSGPMAAELSWSAATWRRHQATTHAANRAQQRRSLMPLTWFLVAAIILAALYLRRFPLGLGSSFVPPSQSLGGPPVLPPAGTGSVILGPVGGGGPR